MKRMKEISGKEGRNHYLIVFVYTHPICPNSVGENSTIIQVYCPYSTLGYERPTPHLLTDTNIHSDTQAEPRKLSSLTLYIDLWQEGKPAPGQNPPVTSPPVAIFRRIGFRAEIRTQNPVLAKMVPLSHLRRENSTTGAANYSCNQQMAISFGWSFPRPTKDIDIP
jgi:hypothetical protein